MLVHNIHGWTIRTTAQIHVTKMEKDVWIYTIIRLSFNDPGVSQQMAFISGQSLHQLSQYIFETFQVLAVAKIKCWQTHTQTDCYNPPLTLGLIIINSYINTVKLLLHVNVHVTWFSRLINDAYNNVCLFVLIISLFDYCSY